jgi:hypothetical protein
MENNQKEAWKSFIINMLGVIFAIALTFGLNSLWQQHEEKKRLTEMLILVRNELEGNKEWFKRHEQNIMNDCRTYKKIMQANGDFTNIPRDTLKSYLNQILSWEDYIMTTTAWQIFQNSDIIQKMTNKDLVIRLTECYSIMAKIRETLNSEYWDKKKKINSFDQDPLLFFNSVMKNKEWVFFFEIMSREKGDNGFWKMFPTVDAFIDYTLMLIDKHGNYRYNGDEKDEEMVSFIKAQIDSLNQLRNKNVP